MTINANPSATTESLLTTDPGTTLDLGRLRLSQDFASNLGVRKLLTTVPVRKPNRQEFVRVHPDDAYRLETVVLELKEERETYLIDPALWPGLPTELVAKVLYPVINRQGVLSIWPIRLPGQDGRLDDWNTSALDAARRARERWIRLVPNMSLGAYEIYEASGEIPEPEWPELSLQEILQIAFKGRYITQEDHPVIRQLRGEL